MKCEIIDPDVFLKARIRRRITQVKKALKTIAFVRMKGSYVVEKDKARIELLAHRREETRY